ncbi:hypothetical protein ABCS02_26410 [Microbacterium sp. X-17]|uniref:hypothetical protein n=1 Tax=Microbacterium sp. X-17 TaxID=3144404 RepID=UPI0031F53406
MVDVPERRSSLTPARLLIGSLVLGGGIVALGMLFGGGTANAAEPPAPSPLGGVVAAVASVTPAAPAPVAEVAAQVVQPVASGVREAAGAAPVEAVVSPVADAADRVVAAPVELVAPGAATPELGAGAATATAPGAPAQAADTPASPAPAPQTSSTLALVRTLAAPLSPVTSLLANHPVSTLTAPIAAAADGVLAGVAGVVVQTVQPLVPAGVAPAGEQSALPSVDVQPAVARVAAVSTVRATASSYSPASAPATGAPSALLADAPHGDSDVPVPGTPSGVLGTSASGAQAGGYGSGVATLGGNASPATALGVRAGLPADDDLPTSPVFDHDISPD